ncbi:MAG TPA: MlaD family protein [Gemmatimonadales bacterium]|jgi:phospholipid/cholesterol/gamma-HCH transport system substrate-binding protein|nr:MlaD family protein [Gemmatimonadales bacterium]
MDLHYKQEVTVGALVVVGVALFVGGTMWLGGRSFSRAPTVPIVFSDAGTLKKGSPVRVSGVTLGSVESIDFQDFGKVLVEVTLDPRVKPKSDASARLASVGLVADAIINFNPGTAPDPLPRGKVVAGTVETGFMALGSELGERAKTVMSGISEVANAKLADDLRRTMTAVQRMADLYSNPEHGPSAELTRTLSEVQRMSRRLDSLLDDARPAATVRRADSLMGELTRLSADARSTSARLDTLLARVNRGEGTLGRFATDTAFYANAQRVIKSLQEFVDDLKKHPGKIGITVRVF